MEIINLLRNFIASQKLDDGNLDGLCEILDQQEKKLKTSTNPANLKRCINLEGFDACGKSTISLLLRENLQNSRLLQTPPLLVSRYRSFFDKQEETIRRLFYNLGNLIVSNELIDTTHNDELLILDRYWPSTIAYKLARQTEKSLESINNELVWPNYLNKPTRILYLFVPEDERLRRIEKRSVQVPITLEEEQLKNEQTFRHRLDKIYRQIPDVEIIDANRPPTEIVRDILQNYV
ncbi:unnamed protein product [Didymodactylos carnosus]|uniref:Thymidylate kinase-like domain-containing protein n=1 Tax=Didymodactylos carnosus TaxID=1234261 RepID=A0A814SZB7_9BILA|nr:unnamed protein product [Didymodactylos carnosus]CAF3916546.1 unnamed protein product [Didymodactylos carnosus]